MLPFLRTKAIHIVITNICNLECGGCNQLIGSFPKSKLFFEPFDSIMTMVHKAMEIARVDWLDQSYIPSDRVISIYGGEPTLHPEFERLLETFMTEYPTYPFLILTNGRTNPPRIYNNYPAMSYLLARPDIQSSHRNIFYRISPKSDPTFPFFSTLQAAADIDPNPDPYYYYELAKANCRYYRECETCFYRGKAYFCFVAAAMDYLYNDSQFGWSIGDPIKTNPFDRPESLIAEQASYFCRRCCMCLPDPPRQPISEPTIVSLTNKTPLPRK